MEKVKTTYLNWEDETASNALSIFYKYDELKEKHENNAIDDNELYHIELDDCNKTVFKSITTSEVKTTQTTNRKEVSENYTVLSYQNWIGEVLSVQEKSFKAHLRHTLGEYSERLVDINRNILNKIKLNKELKEGMCFYWSFKEIRTNKGQIKKVDSLDFINEVQRPAFEIEEQIEKEMQKLSFLFDDNNDE